LILGAPNGPTDSPEITSRHFTIQLFRPCAQA
jgi:hypothetical protein